MNTLQLAELKRFLLQEIGDASAKDLPDMDRSLDKSASEFDDTTRYTFNLGGLEYAIRLTKHPAIENEWGGDEEAADSDREFRLAYDVSFGVVEGIGKRVNYNKEVNSPKTVFKVMTNVVKAIADEAIVDLNNGARITQIFFAPVKDDTEDDRREKLYFLYVKKLLGQDVKITREEESDDTVQYLVDIPEDFNFLRLAAKF
jgi:hypothetical protein